MLEEQRAAQNDPICTPLPMNATGLTAAHNGGSRATAATSNHHAARLVFQNMSEPSADYLAVRSPVGRAGGAQIPQFWGVVRVPPAMSVVMGEVARVSWGVWPLPAAATVEVCFLPGGLGVIEAP